MLVVTRRTGEKIVLDNGVTIEIVRVRGQEVRVGIAAPPEVAIAREELLDGPKPRPRRPRHAC